MDKVTWAVQTNLGEIPAIEKLRQACEDTGNVFVPFQAIPFCDDLPDLPTDGPTVFYGSTNVIHRIHKSQRWNPGTFFNEGNFNFSTWSKRYKCLNAYGHTMTLARMVADFKHLDIRNDREFFIRPVADDKAFAGTVMNAGEITEWVGELSSCDSPQVSPDTVIMFAKPVHIAREWRIFIVNGHPSNGSLYRVDHKLKTSAAVPIHVVDFARQQAKLFQPASVFTMDIAEASGELYVIEVNCFNSSGFYDSNVSALVGDISHFLTK